MGYLAESVARTIQGASQPLESVGYQLGVCLPAMASFIALSTLLLLTVRDQIICAPSVAAKVSPSHLATKPGAKASAGTTQLAKDTSSYNPDTPSVLA